MPPMSFTGGDAGSESGLGAFFHPVQMGDYIASPISTGNTNKLSSQVLIVALAVGVYLLLKKRGK